MKEYASLKTCQLFKGLEENISDILSCLRAHVVSCDKDNFVVMEGDPIESIGIVLTGRLRLMKEDINGNTSMIDELGENDIFGESVCAGLKSSFVTVQAAERSDILFLNYRKVITLCSSVCAYHLKLVENMLELIAAKNVMLAQKMEIIAKRTIRERLLSYFELQSKSAKSRKFSIPFSRTELAFFLCVDRSAMTRELGSMAENGLIRFDKRNFELL